MEELFPEVMRLLTEAAERLKGIPRIVAGGEEEAADAMTDLHTRLIELNSVLFFEYAFDAGQVEDVLQYTALLQEYEAPCAEKIGYLLERHQMFGGGMDPQAQFLQEVLLDIITQSATICRTVYPYGAPPVAASKSTGE